jgi:hypothetical protein
MSDIFCLNRDLIAGRRSIMGRVKLLNRGKTGRIKVLNHLFDR